MQQKLQTIFQKATGSYDQLSEYKQSMIQSYEEIAYIADNTECLTQVMKDELHETFDALKKEELEHFKLYQENYYHVRAQYKKYMDDNCLINQ